MTQPVTIQEHSHVYLFKPVDSQVTTHPQTLYIWLRPTEITEPTVTSSISSTIIKPYNITLTDVTEPYYDKYYRGTNFPVTITKPYQRLSFPYYFTDACMAILTISYTYSYTCPSEINTFITDKLSQKVSHADIKELLAVKDYGSTDVQNWIDAIEASVTPVLSEDSTSFIWTINQMVTPKWTNT